MITIYIKNGFYIPFICFVIWYITNDTYLSMLLYFKLYNINYFYWFSPNFSSIPSSCNMLKQFVRFTDTGFIASSIYYFYPDFFPVAHNVHFVITVGYWIGKYMFNMMETNDSNSPDMMEWYVNVNSNLLHIIPYVCILRQMMLFDTCYDYFDWTALLYSYYWIQCWFIYIYIPWRMITKDCVYNMLTPESSPYRIILVAFVIHASFFVGHLFGKTALYILCS